MLRATNEGYTDLSLIHYAVTCGNAEIIQALVGHLSLQERLEIFQAKFKTGCNSLHFIANTPNLTEKSLSILCKVKNLIFSTDEHSSWLQLLTSQQDTLETPLPYAARHISPNFIKLSSLNLKASSRSSSTEKYNSLSSLLKSGLL
jgi:hypothetical protein